MWVPSSKNLLPPVPAQVCSLKLGVWDKLSDTESRILALGQRQGHVSVLGGEMKKQDPQSRVFKCGLNNDNPQRCLCPNPLNLWIWYFIWQKGLCRYNTVKDLEVQRIPKLSGWVQYNHKGLYKGELGGSESEEEMGWWKQRLKGCGHEPRNASSL